MAGRDDASASPGGWRALAGSPRFPAIVVVSFGVWLHAGDELMVSTVSPAMIAEIGGAPFVAWLIALYEVGSILAGALAAHAVGRAGLRLSLVAAALVYMCGCLASGLAPAMPAMLAGRLVQGLGGGAMISIAFIAVYRLAGARLSAPVYALMSAIWGVSAFSGPMIGALFADAGWWRGAFHLFAVQAIVFAALVATRLPADRPEKPAAEGVGELGVRLLALAGGIVMVATAGISTSAWQALTLLAAGLGAIALFVLLDGRSAGARLLPPRPFDVATPAGAAILACMLASVATTGLIAYGPLLMTRLHGFDAALCGLVLLTESIGWSLVAIATAHLRRDQEPAAILGGFVAVALGVGLLAPAIARGSAFEIAACAFLQGGGFGAAWGFLVRRATSLAGSAEADRLAGAIPTSQRIGYALGAAAAGIVANASGIGESLSEDAALAANWRIFPLSFLTALAAVAAIGRFLRFREMS